MYSFVTNDNHHPGVNAKLPQSRRQQPQPKHVGCGANEEGWIPNEKCVAYSGAEYLRLFASLPSQQKQQLSLPPTAAAAEAATGVKGVKDVTGKVGGEETANKVQGSDFNIDDMLHLLASSQHQQQVSIYEEKVQCMQTKGDSDDEEDTILRLLASTRQCQQLQQISDDGSASFGEALVGAGLAQIPMKDKIEYLEAIGKCPELVSMESPAIAYLTATNYDVLEAARKLALYWKCRKKVFGDAKTFLPLTFDGAMADDVEYIGCACRYDGTNRDMYGRPVILGDRTSASYVPMKNMRRNFFYQFQLISMDVESQRNGIVKLENRVVS